MPDLVAVLTDNSKDQTVRWRSVQALIQIGPFAKDAVPTLIEAMRGDDETIVRSAVAVISKIGPAASGAVPHLIQIVKDQESKWRHQAMIARGEVHGSQSYCLYQENAESEPVLLR